jgi:hypothetical protein
MRHTRSSARKRRADMPPSDRADLPRSHTFVLTLWRERQDGPWRAALRLADGGVRVGFADLEQLAAFLLSLADQPAQNESAKRKHKSIYTSAR